MKKTLKGYLLGFISATLLVGCITAFAANTTTLYDVIANGVKIVVDGQKLNPTDANGNKVEPIIYNGTTYLPVRAVASALGKAVYWDGPNYTVYLGNMDGKLEYPTVELEDMTLVGGSLCETNLLTDNYGNRYAHAISNESDLEYLLNMKYSKFKGTLYVAEGVKVNKDVFLKIIADGKTIYTSPSLNKTSSPVNIDLNIRGYNNLKFEFSDHIYDDTLSNCEYWDKLLVCLGDAGFYQ